jgi:SAM-dependent methyltransferase
MTIETIQHEGHEYPRWQSEGFAAQFAWPFAQRLCRGRGLDIGCNRVEWAFPGAVMIDPNIDASTDAYALPNGLFDYIFSSHCLEHLPDWVGALDHWHTRLRVGGVMFLYLPHYEQTYWRPWNNRKHVSVMQAEHVQAYFESRNYKKIMVTPGYDLNHSFYAIAEK